MNSSNFTSLRNSTPILIFLLLILLSFMVISFSIITHITYMNAIQIIIIILFLILGFVNTRNALLFIFIIKFSVDYMWAIEFPLFEYNILHILGVLVPLVCLLALFKRNRKIVLRPLTKLMIYFLSFFLFSSIVMSAIISAVEIMSTFRWILVSLNWGLIFFVVPYLFNTKKDINMFFDAWLIASIVPILLSLFQFFVHESAAFQISGQVYRLKGLFHDASNNAIIGSIVVLFGLFKLKLVNNKIYRCLLLILCVFGIFLLIYSGVRMAWFAIVVCFTVYYIVKKRWKWVAVLAFLVILTGLLVPMTTQRFKEEYQYFSGEEEIYTSSLGTGRIGLWRETIATFNHRPLYQKILGHLTPFHAHQEYLNLLLKIGFVGLAIYISIIYKYFIYLSRLLRIERDEFLREFVLIALLFQIMVVILSLAGDTFRFISIRWILGFFMGIVMYRFHELVKNNKDNQVVSREFNVFPKA